MASIEASGMTPWQEFYHSVKDSTWPDCDTEADFDKLPRIIQQEIIEVHGYSPGDYRKQSQLVHRRFPIVSDTACQLKWTWSTIFLTTGHTASCHRTNHHLFDLSSYDFHNTPEKLQDRRRMLDSQWPDKGCDYCRKIEDAGGQSDRITNLYMAGIHAPPELDDDKNAVVVTPRILEVYFDNLCNLKCLYCGPYFSSLWDAENKKHGSFSQNGVTISADFKKSQNLELSKRKMFDWMKINGHHLTNFNILGGEPLFQSEFEQCLDFFETYPAPELDLQIFSNLNASAEKIDSVIAKVKSLIDRDRIRQFTVTASLDCWGAEAEYARFPLNLSVWKRNFERLLQEPWIRLVVGSTITPLTVTTLSDLVVQLNDWRKTREIFHYFNSVNGPSYLLIDIFGDLFEKDFQRVLELMPERSQEDYNTKKYLQGIATQSISGKVQPSEILKLKTFLDEMDRRRSTKWQKVYPWLETMFEDILAG